MTNNTINLKGKVIALFFICIFSILAFSQVAFAKEKNEKENSQLVQATISIPTTYADYNGEIEGNGVRLRKSASDSATVLELMYQGELIYIDFSKQVNGWYYIKRLETGTWGYVRQEYCLILNRSN